MALWLFPPPGTIWVAIPAIPVPVSVTRLLAAPTIVAVPVLRPACRPTVQLPTRAIPSVPVTTTGLVMLPPPAATVNYTVAPPPPPPLQSSTTTHPPVPTTPPPPTTYQPPT